ncbi:phosphoadenylyl-sulfate reductase [Parvularcula marina]|uniref:phosphoadenylyl-sulfate reductase n=1 Tax=Parvularcula marina TaxID=2292771 RepID=UPI0035143FCE
MVDLRNRDSILPGASERALLREISDLNDLYETLTPQEIIEDALARRQALFGHCAAVSSFGAESAVLLHMIAQVEPALPIVMLDTGKLFGETLQYRNQLQHVLGLEDIRSSYPRKSDLAEFDPLGTLSATNPDQCCRIRKTDVLKRALSPFDSWFNGRKRYQSDVRSVMSIVERDDGRLKINPLANWDAGTIRAYQIEHELPVHPLLSKGYGSIGCYPCTSKVKAGEDARAGRWRGLDKSECGLHGKG